MTLFSLLSTTNREPSAERTRTQHALLERALGDGRLELGDRLHRLRPTWTIAIEASRPACSAALPSSTPVMTTPAASVRPSCLATSRRQRRDFQAELVELLALGRLLAPRPLRRPARRSWPAARGP